ncbi:cellulose binding domain-containing protein [Glycomyces sp. TRM65418]|uniref:cellulose binding domain-containing protein n=1 Tax=Glycomyces sp. TRM65418 TaxID=2867006 RepID=UPI001CE62AD9|nr:cellulose binding domain-containing protein [Glycomyces sp. TRM65418]MCC3765034.1 cellulose binding domain-containing protein [Glycomyces sp. TRM65418]QZD54663.1 cellulose binding domain-containing protein [Glycomyces sp. TRM65418]
MDEHDDASTGRGRLHGRALQILGVVSTAAVLIALWQFGVFGEEPDRDPVGAVEGPVAPSISDAADDPSTTQVTPTISATSESLAESSAAETSTAPSDAASSSRPPVTTTAAEPPEEDAAATACSASLTLNQSWDDMIEVTVVVVNSGAEEIESWEIDLSMDGADIEHSWNMRHLGDGRYGSEGWNGRLDPDEDAVTGFQAEVDRGFELPDSVPCTAVA